MHQILLHLPSVGFFLSPPPPLHSALHPGYFCKKTQGQKIQKYAGDIVPAFQKLDLMRFFGLFWNSIGPYLTKYFIAVPPEIPRGVPMLLINSLRQN